MRILKFDECMLSYSQLESGTIRAVIVDYGFVVVRCMLFFLSSTYRASFFPRWQPAENKNWSWHDVERRSWLYKDRLMVIAVSNIKLYCSLCRCWNDVHWRSRMPRKIRQSCNCLLGKSHGIWLGHGNVMENAKTWEKVMDNLIICSSVMLKYVSPIALHTVNTFC